MDNEIKHVILYDGFCKMCNFSLRMVIKYDKKRTFQYFPLQSKEAKALLSLSYREINIPDSIVLLQGHNMYVKSEAFFKIISHLGFQFKIFMIFRILPLPFRDRLYDWVARNRYMWFGKNDECSIDLVTGKNNK